MRRYARIAAYVAYIVLFCIGAGEITVRLLYDRFRNYNMEMWRYASDIKRPLPRSDLPFHHFPGKTGTYYGVKIETNSMGFRDTECAVEKPNGKTRIIALGDSFTLGWGVEFAETFSQRLEHLLAERGYPVEVINMGVGNYNTTMEVELFKWKGLALDPDVVILMFFVNDPEPVPPRRPALTYAAIKHSYFGAFLFDRLVRVRARFIKSFEWDRYYRSLYSARNEANIRANMQAVKDLIATCRAGGIRLLIVNIPEMHDLKNYRFGYATDYIRNLAEEGGVPFLDLLPALAAYEPESLWVSPEDPHANSRANAVMADEIMGAVLGAGVL
jgi:lysophospholipase L1-like esterase